MSETVDERVGRKIAELRSAAGIPRKQLAAALDLTTQQVANIENGRTKLSAAQLVSISTAVGCEATVLLREFEQ